MVEKEEKKKNSWETDSDESSVDENGKIGKTDLKPNYFKKQCFFVIIFIT